MKYRKLTQKEQEAYEIGYKVGNRQIVITDIEWESDTEHSIYRKGYMAGLMDYKRNTNKKSAAEATDTEGKTRTIHNTELTVQDKPITTDPARQAENKKAFENAIAQITGANTGADASVEKRIAQDGTAYEGIVIKNKTLLAFIKHRFPKKTTDRVSSWAIDHNEYGKKYTSTSLIRLLTKFQTDIEPGIDYHKTMAEYIEFAGQNESV